MSNPAPHAASVNALGFVHRYIAPTPGAVDEDVTLLLLHGTGGDENDLLDLGRLLAPGAGLLSPRGKVREHGMPRFFRRLAEGVFDLDDLRARAHELAEFVAQAAMTYGFDPTKVVAVGFSNGANIATGVMLLRPETLAGAVLFHAQVTLEPEAALDLSGKRILLSAGRADPLVPQAETERLATMLRQRGASVEQRWQPGGHGLTQQEALAAQEWLAQQRW
ncbi:MAG TPA: alpha/beta hydrolase [Ktedonobacterales bacterium]|nr:alpha/beta hydrolase [Ktedonobacterales bacterium]